nr:hypothetical protein TetV2_00131 [Oceanusvirus sp.]
MAAPVQNVPVRVVVFRKRGKKTLCVRVPHGSKSSVETFEVKVGSEGFFPDSAFAEVMFEVDPGINDHTVYMTPKETDTFPDSIPEGTYYLTVDPDTHDFAVSERPINNTRPPMAPQQQQQPPPQQPMPPPPPPPQPMPQQEPPPMSFANGLESESTDADFLLSMFEDPALSQEESLHPPQLRREAPQAPPPQPQPFFPSDHDEDESGIDFLRDASSTLDF